MDQENQVTNPTPVQNLPVKRKRGRPRKDESLRRVEKRVSENPGSETVKRNPHRISNSPYKGDTMLGQVVSGVLDGSFDAGYLVTVKVGETNTILRGVLFNPSLVLPITEANDVASNVKMLKRNEIPLGMPVQSHGSAQRVEARSEQSEKKVSEVAQTSFNHPVALKGVRIDINQVPQVSPQALRQPGIVGGWANDTSQVVQSSQLTFSQNPLDTQVLQNRAPSAGDRYKDRKLEHRPGPSIATLQGNVPEVGGLEHEPNRATDGALKGKAVDLNALPVNTTVDFVAAEPVGDLIRKGGNNNPLATGSQCVSTQLIAERSKMWGEKNVEPKPNTTIQPVASATVKVENQDTINK